MELVLNLKSFAQLLKLAHLMKLNVGMVLVQKTFLNVPKYLLKWIKLALEILHLDAQMDLAEITDWIAQHSLTVLKIHLFFVMTELVKNLWTNVSLPTVLSENIDVQMVHAPVLLVVPQSLAQQMLLICVLITPVRLILEIVYLNLPVLLYLQFVVQITLVLMTEWCVDNSLLNAHPINQSDVLT